MTCKLGIPTASLGHGSAGHTLETRLDAAQKYGFCGVEVSYDDVIRVAQQYQNTNTEPSESDKYTAAWDIKSMCKKRNLEIICVQFLRDYEGLLDRNEHENRFQEFQVWIQVARALGTDMIMMPASALPADQVGNRDLIIKDLQKAADAAQTETPHIRFTFEARCSATRVDKWEYSWDVIKAVDRPNLGLCLDAVHIAGRIFADPAAPSSRVPDGHAAIDLSLRRLVKFIKPERGKVFLVQIGDCYLL
ncbi:unnamed protein product [Clonostachys rhizophaga]|uniref:Xylose isomerase-like TIM barrel domain-containing protein n=1 Tax=Clonostachys rhizophaga TaxID=160324 RepID=A0A9N9VW17_9HYPO|nr:unnamed protein product [Clonostachys rhizophaga]